MSGDSLPPASAAREHVDGRFGVVMVAMAVIVWWPAFTLGAWETIFFPQLFALWAAATAAFVFVLVERRPVGARLWRAFVLLLPSVWLLVTLFTPEETTDLVVLIVDLVAIVTVLLGLPFTMWVLVRIMWPDLGGHTSWRTRWLVIGVVVGVAIVSYLIGLNQDRFLTCEEFTIAGNSPPPGCVHVEP